MQPRLFRLIEKHQHIDERLRLAQWRRGPNSAEIAHLRSLKLRVKQLIHRLTLRTARS